VVRGIVTAWPIPPSQSTTRSPARRRRTLASA